MEDKIEKAETLLHERIDRTDEAVAGKADNIVFNAEDSTIQLVSTIVIREEGNEIETRQVPLGEPIFFGPIPPEALSTWKSIRTAT